MSFNRRLEEAILNKFKNIKQFAESVDISANLVRAYVKADSIPSLDKAKDIAKVLNVSLDWLAYGEINSSNNKEDEIIDLVNLIHCKVNEWLDSRDKEMDLDKKSILVKLIYKKLQLKELEKLSQDEVNQSIDDIIEILDAA